MKRILLALTAFALAFAAAPRAQADVDVSLDFFYNNLADDGSWIEVADYGYCWQPNVAANDQGWRPYADGYWAYTDVGWTWVSYESFGWATYHYGRWARVADYGWLWVPGTEWGPAWVSWRTGGDYVGWAPLPPQRGYDPYSEPVYEGRAITARVDIEFDIGPRYYNFCDVRYFGEPVLRERIFEPSQNITYINQTVNVTNITYNNNVVYNYGPDYNFVSAYSARPIQRLRLERQTNIDPIVAARSGAITKVQGDRLLVSAPMRFQRAPQPVAPRVVKTRLERPNMETGWAGIADANAKAQLQQKIKTEDPKAIAQPRIQPVRPEALRAAAAAARGMPTAAPAATAGSNSPVGNASADGSGTPVPEATAAAATKDKRRDMNRRQSGVTLPPAVAASPGASASPVTAAPNETKGKGKPNRNVTNPLIQQSPAPDAGNAMPEPSASAAVPNEQTGTDIKARGKGKQQHQPAATAPPNALQGGSQENAVPPQNLRPERPVYAPNPPDGSGLRTTHDAKGKRGKAEALTPEGATGTVSGPTAPQDVPKPNARQKQMREQVQQQLAPAAAGGGAPQPRGKGEGKGKREKKAEEQSPPPGQQPQ
jgi:hypothetical protein